MWLAATYLHLGGYEKVEPWLQKVFPIAPEWYPLPRILLAWSCLYHGRMEEASKIAERVLSTNREDRRGNEFTAELALWTWDYEKALRHYRQVQWSPLFSFIWRAPAAYHRTRLGFVLMKLGERSEAENLFTQNEKLCKEKIAAGDRRYGLFEVIAMINAVRGNREEALKWLEEAIEAGWGWHDVALKDPIWESLHDEPRFQQMMAEVKAKVDQMRRRAAEMEEEWD